MPNLDELRCKDCKYYRNVYIHPWSKGVPEEMKGSCNGFACTLPLNEEFMKSFNKEDYSVKDLRVDVHIGMDDSIGCECFKNNGTPLKDNPTLLTDSTEGTNA